MALSYQKTIQAVQQRVEYDPYNSPIYIGQAIRGIGTGSNGWVIVKLTYGVNHNLSSYQTATGAWDNRSSLIYS